MKVAVMGAGAVGCYFGARLHLGGHDVVLIGRPVTVDAINAQGLRLQMGDSDERLPLRASTDPAAVENADLVLFCVKSGDTESTGASMRTHLAAGCTVLCLQNGVDNAERLSRVLANDVVPAAVYVAVAMAGPAHVVHHGRGELIIGPSTGSARTAQAFIDVGIPVEVTALVMNALWAKLTTNCAWNALSALTDRSYGELGQHPDIEETVYGVVRECTAVATAAGFTLPPTIGNDVFELSRSMARQRSSTAQDLARGRHTEIDFINGYVIRQAERFGIDAPLNRLLYALVQLREQTVRVTG